VVSGSLAPSEADRAFFSPGEINAGFRLACAAFPREDLRITIPQGEDRFSALSGFESGGMVIKKPRLKKISLEKSALSFARQAGKDGMPLYILEQISRLASSSAERAYVYRDKGKIIHIGTAPGDLYAIAVDIGTTTIVLALVNLQTGVMAGRFSMVNKQREFGADVISRIQRANEGDLPLLSQTVRRQIAGGIASLCQGAGIDPRRVCKIAVAGNTTMLHLLLGLSCNHLGRAPFTPVTLDFVSCGFRELFEGDLSCAVDMLPGISAYVGADIVSGILFSEIYKSPEPAVLMDIGTNGEMALAAAGKILCTATAAGPAFEGGNIRWGTGSVPGAIASVKYRDGKFETATIEDRPPIGICGSGVVDTVYQGLKNNLILPGGGFNTELSVTGLVLAKTPEGEEIQFCQRDVRELQLAKSAVCSGLETLLHQSGLDCGAVKTLCIAGGFGYNLNFSSGVGIGLIPRGLASKVRLIGNSSLGGAVKYLLCPDYKETLQAILAASKEFDLSVDRYFNEAFVENMEFPQIPETEL
jgi:uncharacterized 2Fe-2S/4Fe-4S cluster protein (DUF4445 family)